MNDIFLISPSSSSTVQADLGTDTNAATGEAVVTGPQNMLGFSYKFEGGAWVAVFGAELPFTIPNSAGRKVTFSKPFVVGQTVDQPSEALATTLTYGSLTGSAFIGETVSITLPTFARAESVTHELWRDAVLISSDPGETYTLTSGDVGSRLMLVSRATNSGGTREVWSNSVGVVTDPATIPASVALTAATSTLASTSGVTIPAPTGHAIGDTLVYIMTLNGSPTMPVPEGWEQLSVQQGGTTQVRVFRRVATGTDPFTFAFNPVVSEAYTLRKFAFPGRQRVLVAPSYASSVDPSTPAITLPRAQGAYVISALSCAGNASNLPTAAPAGYEQLTAQNSGTSSGGNRMYMAVFNHTGGAEVVPPSWTSATGAFVRTTIAVITDPNMAAASGSPDDVITASAITPYAYPIAPYFTGSDLTYSVLPTVDALTIDPATGVLSINREGAGIYDVTVTATNALGAASVSFTAQVGIAAEYTPALWQNGWGAGNYYISDAAAQVGIEISDNLRSWTDAAAYFTDGIVFAQAALPDVTVGKYVRGWSKETGRAKQYTNHVGPLPRPDNSVAQFTEDRIGWVIPESFAGAGTARDIFLSVLYYNSTGSEAEQHMVSIGNSGSGSEARCVSLTKTWFMGYNTGGNFQADSDASVAGQQWVLNTGRYWHDGTGYRVKSWCQESVSDTVAAANMTINRLMIGGRADGPSTNSVTCNIAYVVVGRGDPEAFHNWALNVGPQSINPLFRDAALYDWDADPNAELVTIIPLHGLDLTGDIAMSQITDTAGILGTPTLFTGQPAWISDKPGFVDNVPVDPDTPEAFIYPMISPPGVTHWLSNKWSKIGVIDPVARDMSKFTLTSLVHSELGDISDRVQPDGSFEVDEPGTVSYTLTYRRFDWKDPQICSDTLEIIEPMPLQANPINTDAVHGNGFVCQMPPYPAQGTGTVFASIADLQAAIIALPAGENLVIADIEDLDTSTGAITVSGKDFGGSVIACENLYGVRLRSISFSNCRNLTLRGFDVKGGFSVSPVNGGGYARVEYCQGCSLTMKGTLGEATVPAPSHGSLFVDCWKCNEDETYQNAQSTFSAYWSAEVKRSIFAYNRGSDVTQFSIPHRTIVDRCFMGYSRVSALSNAHVDCIQMHAGSNNTSARGLFMNTVTLDPNPADGSSGFKGAQGFFLTECPKIGMLLYNTAARVTLANGTIISQGRQSTAIVNSHCLTAISNNTLPNSGRTENCLSGHPGSSFVNNGVAVNCTRGVRFADWPNWSSEAGNWRCFKAPPEFAGRGADGFIQALLDHEAALAA